MTFSSVAAYRLWATSYDETPNPVTALERRVLRERISIRPGERWLDLGTGTGFWLNHALAAGADAFGVDRSAEMLGVAARGDRSHGRLVCGDMGALPIRSGWADIAICSFALSYCPKPAFVFNELARVARTIVLSDLHPDAFSAGWMRSFRLGGQSYQIEHFPYTQAALDTYATTACLRLLWRVEASFGMEERHIFREAGKEAKFEAMTRTHAILCSAWGRA